MSQNQITTSSIKKLIKKLKKKRKASPESIKLLAAIVGYTTAFIVASAKDLSEDDGSSFLRNSDLRKVFSTFGLEKLYDDTYKEFLAEYVNK
ncbi:putative Histone-fold protein [Pseudoloma neurophilia]|uniref:Putative Histone-fold protein n=1 Tax=Pseudoloma neurophilia TaxID=146866 RepID=A0A0R0LY90_9MICR|nr:putative Histone-fold protein [Pseudoloma neurophilia]